MGQNITNFINIFDNNLVDEINKQNVKKTNFESFWNKAKNLTNNKTIIWPNDPSVKTIGDLLTYVFPIDGKIKKEPPGLINGTIINPEYVEFINEIKSDDNVKEIYDGLNKYYKFDNIFNNALQEKGGGQLWFDYLMYFINVWFFKSEIFSNTISTANLNVNNPIYQLMSNGVDSVNYYTQDLFYTTIYNDTPYNSYRGVNKFLTSNLVVDESVLYDAFIEAGDNYVGEYTNSILPNISFFNYLEGPVDQSVVGPTSSSTEDVIDNTTGLTYSGKIKLNLFDEPEGGFVINAKSDLPVFSIIVGDVEPKVFDVFDDLSDLDPEYRDGSFEGAEQLGVTPEEFKLEEEIANNQLDSDSYVGDVGEPVDIKPVSSLDELLKLAGKCARELGKNSRVKYENLKINYKKGVHGLCPQGTQAVLYAMTGVKSLGKISGNAEDFSFKNNRSKFPSGYFNNKVKIGSDFTKDKSKWQIGDVIAVGYLDGKPYGHIQVWTGKNWMSDFKQNRIQTNKVDWNTAALWRLNQNGIEAVNKQFKTT